MAREGTVYLYLFIVAMILFVLATVAFIFKYNDADELKAQRDKAKDELLLVQQANAEQMAEVGTLKRLVAGPNAEDMFGSASAEKMSRDIKERNLKRVTDTINGALKDLGQEEKSFNSLIAPYAEIGEIFTSYQKGRDSNSVRTQQALDSYAALQESEKEKRDRLEADLVKRNEELADAQQQWEDCEAEKDTRVAQLTQELEQKEEELTDELRRKDRIIQQKENYIATLTILVETLQKKQRRTETFDDADPDGELVNVATHLGKGWIDLGREDHLKSGLVFRVYQPIKGGKKLFKGKVEVRRVEEDHAEVRIIEQEDPDRLPITAGDKITSPFYDQEERPILVLAGTGLDSRDVTLDFLKGKLGAYGVDVKTDVDIYTTYLVALKDYEQSPEYRVAQKLNIPILRESELLEFIGY